MKVTCYKADLLEALQVLIHFVAVKPMTPILSGIYIKASGNTLEMESNNLATGMTLSFKTGIESEGEVVVNGKTFQSFIRNMPDDTITLSAQEGATTFSLTSGGAFVELLTMPATDYPHIKKPDTYGLFKIRSTALKNLIRKTIFAVAKDNDRPIFKGCCFEIRGNRLNAVATNAQRIAIVQEDIQNIEGGEFVNFVLPTETLRCLMQNFDPGEVENFVDIRYSNRSAIFVYKNLYINSRFIDGEFPVYDKALETEYVTCIKVNKAEFRQAVDLVALTARESDYKAIKFDIMQDCIKISASSSEIGEARKTIEAEVSGDMMEIAFNVDYVVDVLRVLDTSNIYIKLGNRYEPGLFCEENNDNYSYILTPVRI